ncbi:hypothetical protein D3C75_852300 [compost metagenome]
MTGGVFRHCPPASADFQQVIACGQRQLFAQAFHFCLLGLGESLVVGSEQRAGVEQIFIEKVRIEFVTQIVMGGDVFPRLFAVITPRPVAKPLHGIAQQAKTTFQPSQHLAVEGQDLQKRG